VSGARRQRIPEKQRQELFYESNYCCVVCQGRGSHIHHIDHNNSNNESDNLVVVCQPHHDDAHTKRELSQNLTPAHLKNFKARWTSQVAAERERKASVSGQKETADFLTKIGLTWGYINHKRVAQLVDDDMLTGTNPALFRRCKASRLVDERGIIIKPTSWVSSGEPLRSTIYDWFPYGDDQALHLLYSDFVDQISRRVKPIHLFERNWNKTFVRDILNHGDFIFLIKDNYFKETRNDGDSIHIRGLARKNNIVIEYFVDTIDMFGTTSITVSFQGHNTCSALLQIKSIDTTLPDQMTIRCTPIALGVCFRN
jgi:hypothetical protein